MTLITAHTEQLVVELRTGTVSSTHAQTALSVALPDGVWNLSSGIEEGPADIAPWVGYFDLSVRALYNTTVKAFAV